MIISLMGTPARGAERRLTWLISGARGGAHARSRLMSHMMRATCSSLASYLQGSEEPTVAGWVRAPRRSKVQFVENSLRTRGSMIQFFLSSIPPSPVFRRSVHTALGSTVNDGPTRTTEMDELEPLHQEPTLNPDLVQVHKEFELLT
jgi:hypothetical protein